eukprot:scaffold2295_cov93-Skeletonema_dohrnii-CCMP3373.AAC.11
MTRIAQKKKIVTMMMWLLQIQEKGQGGIEWIVCGIKTCSSMSKERMGMKKSWGMVLFEGRLGLPEKKNPSQLRGLMPNTPTLTFGRPILVSTPSIDIVMLLLLRLQYFNLGE